MLGCEMEFQPTGNAVSLGRVKGFIQTAQRMNIEIVEHNANNLSLRKMKVNQVFKPMSKIDFSTPLSDLNLPPALKGLEGNKQIAGSLPCIFMVHPTRATRLHGKGQQDIIQELAGTFINAHQREFRVIGQSIEVEHFFHMID